MTSITAQAGRVEGAVEVPPKKSEWPLVMQALDRFGYPTLLSGVMLFFLYQGTKWIANEIIVPVKDSVLKTHESFQETAKKQSEIDMEQTIILKEIKDVLAEGRR